MMPPDDFLEANSKYGRSFSANEIAEEERVLFVGATRAKKTLMIGHGQKMYSSRINEHRTYRNVKYEWRNKARQVEIGLKGDIDPLAAVNGKLGVNSDEIQDWLWNNAEKRIELEARYENHLKSNVLYTVDDDFPIGILSKSFSNDLWDIGSVLGKKTGGGRLKPNETIKRIRMVGTTTIAVPEAHRHSVEKPWRHSGFILAPVVMGFPIVFFNKWRGR